MGASNSSAGPGRPDKRVPARRPPAAQPWAAKPGGTTRVYQLYVRADDGAWSWICTFGAPCHAEAFRQTLACLRGDEFERPIRLEQDTEGAFCKPCDRGCGSTVGNTAG
jgi:hypothetical protein